MFNHDSQCAQSVRWPCGRGIQNLFLKVPPALLDVFFLFVPPAERWSFRAQNDGCAAGRYEAVFALSAESANFLCPH